MMVGVAAAAVGESLHPAQSQDSSKNFGFIQVSRKSHITGGCQGCLGGFRWSRVVSSEQDYDSVCHQAPQAGVI